MLDMQTVCGGSSGSSSGFPASPSLTSAIFINNQQFADSWLEMELNQKLQAVGAEDRATSLHKARLLKFWAADVQEALEVDDGPGPSGSAGAGGDAPACLSAGWLWAALGPASGDRSTWEAVLSRLVAASDPSRAASTEGVHHAAAAALAIGLIDEAVHLYLKSDLLVDALLLARLRLPGRHPLIGYVYRQWAADLKRRGRHDQSAACQLAVGELGAALADLEDWLPPRRSQLLGPDPVRLAGAFAAACVSAALATAHLRPTPEAKDEEATDDNDCDASLAFDHRCWWGHPELRAAVQAWKRCIVEALHAGRLSQALALARVGPLQRAPTAGERFLRGALAGYASAIAWWRELHSQSFGEDGFDRTQEKEEGDMGRQQQPLHTFLRRGSSAIADGGECDWDFEWRALTWLPAFGAMNQEDPLLAAAVELGRSCASLASGATRAAAADDAPWAHLASSVDCLLRASRDLRQPRASLDDAARASASTATLAAATASGSQLAGIALCRLAALSRRPGCASRSQGECVASTAQLAASQLTRGSGGHKVPKAKASDEGSQWLLMGTVLFGNTSTSSVSEILRQAYGFSRLSAQEAVPSASLLERVAGVVLRLSTAPDPLALAIELEQAAVIGLEACGFPAPPGRPESLTVSIDPDSLVANYVQRLKDIHSSCSCKLLVPLALSAWCQRWLEGQSSPMREGPKSDADQEPEYEVTGEEDRGPAGATSCGSSASASVRLLHGIAEFVAESWADAQLQTEAAEAADLEGLLKLEAVESLAWRSRLELLKGEASHGVNAVCQLLEALPSMF
ncbi:unnamed protein product [Polarella glacialis]|uniref:Gem-associated protein 5 TPR domain-containing protein n=1 Tax=Polarella glacialis TaxID=89957 RepID=A0A813K421_POLGL|nr:unnamed protein product [Polarella glacialis]